MTFEEFLNKLFWLGACQEAQLWCEAQGSIEAVYNNLDDTLVQRRWVAWLLYALKNQGFVTVVEIDYFLHYEDEEYSVDVLRARLPLVDLICLLEKV